MIHFVDDGLVISALILCFQPSWFAEWACSHVLLVNRCPAVSWICPLSNNLLWEIWFEVFSLTSSFIGCWILWSAATHTVSGQTVRLWCWATWPPSLTAPAIVSLCRLSAHPAASVYILMLLCLSAITALVDVIKAMILLMLVLWIMHLLNFRGTLNFKGSFSCVVTDERSYCGSSLTWRALVVQCERTACVSCERRQRACRKPRTRLLILSPDLPGMPRWNISMLAAGPGSWAQLSPNQRLVHHSSVWPLRERRSSQRLKYLQLQWKWSCSQRLFS